MNLSLTLLQSEKLKKFLWLFHPLYLNFTKELHFIQPSPHKKYKIRPVLICASTSWVSETYRLVWSIILLVLTASFSRPWKEFVLKSSMWDKLTLAPSRGVQLKLFQPTSALLRSRRGCILLSESLNFIKASSVDAGWGEDKRVLMVLWKVFGNADDSSPHSVGCIINNLMYD